MYFLFQEYRFDFAFITSMNIMIFLLRCFLKLISVFPSRFLVMGHLQAVFFNCVTVISQHDACFATEKTESEINSIQRTSANYLYLS